MELQVGKGSRVVNGVTVSVSESKGNAISLRLDRREVHLKQNHQVIIEYPDPEKREENGTVFLTLLKVQRGVAIFRESVQRNVSRREIVRKRAQKNRPMKHQSSSHAD